MAAKKLIKLRRLIDSVGDTGEHLLVPILEKGLLEYGVGVWPEEYPIRIENKERIWDAKFHPSSHSVTPERMLYYMFHPQTHDAMEALSQSRLTSETILTFQIGSAFHALMQSMLINMGLTTIDEVEVSFVNEKRNCSGSLDVRKIFLPSGEYPLEIKSASYIPQNPPPAYVRQLQVYMDLGCGDEPVEKAILLYIQKGAPHKLKEFVIYRDELVLEAVYTKWERVLEAISFNQPESLQCCMKDTCNSAILCGVSPVG